MLAVVAAVGFHLYYTQPKSILSTRYVYILSFVVLHYYRHDIYLLHLSSAFIFCIYLLHLSSTFIFYIYLLHLSSTFIFYIYLLIYWNLQVTLNIFPNHVLSFFCYFHFTNFHFHQEDGYDSIINWMAGPLFHLLYSYSCSCLLFYTLCITPYLSIYLNSSYF